MSNDLAVKEKKDSYENVRAEHMDIAQVAYFMSKEIVDIETLEKAVDHLHWIKEKRRMWEAMVRPVIQSAHEAHRKAIALHKYIDQPLERAEVEFLKPALDAYDLKQERKRLADEAEANRKLQEEAKRKYEAEEKQRAEEVDKNRIVDEQGKTIPPSVPPPPLSPPPIVPTVVIPREAKPEGVSYVDNWTAEVVDFGLLVNAVSSGTLPIDALLPNKSYINQSVKALKGFMKWPGVAVKKERGVRVSQRREDAEK